MSDAPVRYVVAFMREGCWKCCGCGGPVRVMFSDQREESLECEACFAERWGRECRERCDRAIYQQMLTMTIEGVASKP